MALKTNKIMIIDHVHPALTERLEAAGLTCIQAVDWEDDRMERELQTCIGLVLRSRWSLDAPWLKNHTHLSFIGRVGAGLEHIDTNMANALGIQILSSPEGNRQAVAEQALGMLLSLMHHIRKANDEVQNGIWSRKSNQGDELQGKTVGIVGYGNTGSAFAQLLSGFGVKVLAYDKYLKAINSPFAEQVDMQVLFDRCDVVSLHIPQNVETMGLVDDAWLARFARPIYLINTSRGRIVKDDALLKALDSGKLRGAALDVLSIERDNLSIPDWTEISSDAKALIAHPQVIVTPHIAGLSDQSFEKLASVMADKIIQHLQSA